MSTTTRQLLRQLVLTLLQLDMPCGSSSRQLLYLEPRCQEVGCNSLSCQVKRHVAHCRHRDLHSTNALAILGTSLGWPAPSA